MLCRWNEPFPDFPCLARSRLLRETESVELAASLELLQLFLTCRASLHDERRCCEAARAPSILISSLLFPPLSLCGLAAPRLAHTLAGSCAPCRCPSPSKPALAPSSPLEAARTHLAGSGYEASSFVRPQRPGAGLSAPRAGLTPLETALARQGKASSCSSLSVERPSARPTSRPRRGALSCSCARSLALTLVAPTAMSLVRLLTLVLCVGASPFSSSASPAHS